MAGRDIVVIIPEGQAEMIPIIQRSLMSVRERLRDDPYIIEAIKMLQVSCSGFWICRR
jgi:hypothetical protein